MFAKKSVKSKKRKIGEIISKIGEIIEKQ